MSRTAAEILEDARQLSPGDLQWLLQELLHQGPSAGDEASYAAWREEVGEPEPGYDEWFRAGVEAALAEYIAANNAQAALAVVDRIAAAILRILHCSRRFSKRLEKAPRFRPFRLRARRAGRSWSPDG